MKRVIFIAVLFIFCPVALAQPLSLKPAAQQTKEITKPSEESINTERVKVVEKLKSIERDLLEGETGRSEELKSLRSAYSELLGILDIHLIALAETKRLSEAETNKERSFEQLKREIKRDIQSGSFLELVALETAYVDSREELANLRKGIEQRLDEVRTQNKLAEDLGKQIRLEREQRRFSGASLAELQPLEIKEQIAAATAALRKTEMEGLGYREKIESINSTGLMAEIQELSKHLNFSEEHLRTTTLALDAEIAAVANEIVLRQRELNQELIQSAALHDEVEKRLTRNYSDLLNIYLTLLRSEQEFLEYKKQLLTSRFNLHNGKLNSAAMQQIQREIREKSRAADAEMTAQTQGLSDILEEFAGRHEIFAKVRNFGAVNEKFRTTLRSTMLTVADIGKHNKLMKYFIDTGDFSENATRPGLAALASVQAWAVTLWNFEVFAVDESPITIGKILIALVLFIFGIRLSRRLAVRLIQRLASGKRLDPGAAAAIETISFYALVVLWAIISLQFVRIPLTVFTLAGGALAIGVGLGSQTIVKNFFNGLILLIERPIRVGDLIQYDQTIGTVSKIGTRSTVINTPDNLEVIVPNGHLIENVVTNWTLSTSRMRRKITVGVAYGSPVRDVSQILLAQAEKHNLVLKDPAPDVLFSNFGESTLDFVLRFWINIGGTAEGPRVESDLRHMIYGALKEAGITIAFPQRDVHLNSERPLEIQVVRERPAASPSINTPGSIDAPPSNGTANTSKQ